MSEHSVPKTGGLWARLFGVQSDEDEAQPEPTVALPPEAQAGDAAEAVEAVVAVPAESSEVGSAACGVATPPAESSSVEAEKDEGPALAQPVSEATKEVPPNDQAKSHTALMVLAPPTPVAEDKPPAAPPAAEAKPQAVPPPAEPLPAEPPPATIPCPACGTPSKPKQRYCEDCGWLFGAEMPVPTPEPAAIAASPMTLVNPSRGADMPATSTPTRLRDRYELRQLVAERQGTRRYRGFDHGTGEAVVIIATPLEVPAAVLIPDAAVLDSDDEIMPGFDDDVPVASVVVGSGPGAGDTANAWPGASWEKQLLTRASHPALPHIVDSFVDNGTEYLVEQFPLGNSLWDAWDEADDAATRYGWARQIAEAMHALHQAGAILEGLRPDIVVITDGGSAVLADLADLLPVPVPPSPPLRASLYTAPELILSPQTADARADLYSFGAMLYSLEYLHHAPEEKDFEQKFVPRQITDRYPDVHPLLLRLINKTFVRDVNTRFPTDEAGRTDKTGFVELIRTLETCRRAFDQVRLDIAAWTTTGMVRTGNEDAFCVLHATEQRQDDLYEYALILMCDGMGGYEAGEVAAALAMAKMREFVLQQPMFAALAGKEPPANPPDLKAMQDLLYAALRHANREVYTASRTPGKGRRGMGCTAECVYLDARNVVVAHVGDSRTYHLRRGRLVQLTRDQTFVNRMVELGQLTAAEAEHHPRKNELQQAIGGQPDVVPGLAAGKLQRGDWVLVCSDGLTNHITANELETMMARECAYSAEESARRLLNLTNLRGATDNATIIVARTS
jgi:serine/threonine protein phosphatase PrpC